MPSGYKHLFQEQRREIEIMHKNKVSLRSIAANNGVSPSTLSRELRRNKGERGDFIGISKSTIEISRAQQPLRQSPQIQRRAALYCRGVDIFRLES